MRTRTRIQALIVVRPTERRTGLQVFSDLIEVNPPERAGGDPPPSFDASLTAPKPNVMNVSPGQSQIFSGDPFVRRTR